MDGRIDQVDERLERIENKIDKLSDTQIQIQVDVAEHIRRTAIAEENIDKITQALQPIKHHVTVVQTVITATAWTIGILGAIATIYSAFK
jgi:predicted transcriptional regulator